MAFTKIGEAINVSAADIKNVEHLSADPEIASRLEKIARELKFIAPKAKDFLYFSAVMMHAAEAALLNDDGSLKKDASGNDLEAKWNIENGSWKWVCSDTNVRPYKNANADIFPASELLKAHKQWIGRPLCLDHKSQSVDMVRGIIVDTYYDHAKQRVVAVCALDKKNYPELARKVSTGCSTSVSMGTAVETAICYDCGKVARVETDFCPCMKGKTTYGEINVGLKPIELSIVVSGADPKAQIRHIIAAKDALAQYVDLKDQEIKVLTTSSNLEGSELASLREGLTAALAKVERLEKQASDVSASAEPSLEKVSGEIEKIHHHLTDLQKNINNLYSRSDNNMTTKEAYFQGGGGVNEPTPGKPKYEKEDAESTRHNDDKHMVGQMDTGPVEGMHPGPASSGESEVERKRKLLRAEKEQRAMIRQSALQKAKKKLGYFQGGGGDNEPTPGKTKYTPDPTSQREKDDKQMVGQPPFPDVGKVDGLHPSPASADEKDELKRKEMLSRAKLVARFQKAANPDGSLNEGKSRWNVLADEKLILTATVDELSNGRSEIMFDSIHTKDFGKKILKTIANQGYNKAVQLFKSAQAGPMDPPPPAPMVPAEEPVDDAGGDGDVNDQLQDALREHENTLAKLRETIDALTGEAGELAEFDSLEGDLAPATAQLHTVRKRLNKGLSLGIKEALTELEDNKLELKLAKQVYSNINNLKNKKEREYVSSLVTEGLEQSKVSLASCYQLMEAFVKYARGSENLVKRAIKETNMKKSAQISGVSEEAQEFDPLNESFESISPSDSGQPYSPKRWPTPAAKSDPAKDVSRANLTEQERNALSAHELVSERGPARDESMGFLLGRTQSQPGPMAPSADPNKPGDFYASEGAGMPDAGMADDKKDKKDDKLEDCEEECEELEAKLDEDDARDMNNAVELMLPDGTKATMNEQEAKTVLNNTASGRSQLRTKLAQKGVQYSDMLQKAHPQGGFQTDLDVKPTGNLGRVEDLKEQHAAMEQVATAPPKVRKQAGEIQKLISEGRIDASEESFKKLLKAGLDPEAIKYWKQYYGQSKDGEFASEMVKTYAEEKLASDKEAFQVKIARAYELTYDMVKRNMCADNRPAVAQQVDAIMKFNDEAFDSMKRWVNKQEPMQKTAMPRVGMIGTGEMVLPSAPEVNDLESALNFAFSSSGNKRSKF